MEIEDVTNKVELLIKEFLLLCEQQQLAIDEEFAKFYIQLLACDFCDGIDLAQPFTHCRIHLFLKRAIEQYANPLNANATNIKLYYELKTCYEIDINYVRKKYNDKFNAELQQHIHDILQYPETSNRQQLDQMISKMSIFIVAAYSLGSPKQHVLLDKIVSAINSVITHSDIRNYVLKKKYNRLEYLQRLAATVSGIVIYNNQNKNGDTENLREIFVDIEMAIKNTDEALQACLKRATQGRKYATEEIDKVVSIDVKGKKVYCYVPLTILREINHYTSLFSVCERHLIKLIESFSNTTHLIEVDRNKFRCMMDKIDDVLKYRTSIEAELIFPHFVHLSEIWNSLILYLNHLAELNKIRELIESHMSECLEIEFYKRVETIKARSQANKQPTKPSFSELFAVRAKRKCLIDFLKVPPYAKNFCALTMILAGGLLIPSRIDKKLCENLDIRFGFRHIEHCKYAEKHFADFMRSYTNVIYMSVDLILMFDLVDTVFSMKEEYELSKRPPEPSTREFAGQTEMVIENDLSPANWINVTWNKWDYYRETIRLANLRKKQTHSTQTVVSYGSRTAQNQTYNTREHLTWMQSESATLCDLPDKTD